MAELVLKGIKSKVRALNLQFYSEIQSPGPEDRGAMPASTFLYHGPWARAFRTFKDGTRSVGIRCRNRSGAAKPHPQHCR
jgi:hypothetical protein